MSAAYASGNWHVTQGKENAFVEEWTELLQWTRKTQPGFVRAMLIRHDGEPNHFISFAEWETESARDTWKSTPDFAKHHKACVAMCDDFAGGNFAAHVTI